MNSQPPNTFDRKKSLGKKKLYDNIPVKRSARISNQHQKENSKKAVETNSDPPKAKKSRR